MERFVAVIGPNLRVASYEIERWQSGSFEPCDNVYDRDGFYYGESGMYRITLEGNRSGRTMTLFSMNRPSGGFAETGTGCGSCR